MRYLAAIIFTIFFLVSNNCNAQVYLDSTATIDARVNDLLSRMTLDEKIGQMVQEEYVTLNNFTDIQTSFSARVLTAASDSFLVPYHTPEAWANLCDSLQSYTLKTRLRNSSSDWNGCYSWSRLIIRCNTFSSQYRNGVHTQS